MSIFQQTPDENVELMTRHPDGNRHIAVFRNDDGTAQIAVSDGELVLPMWSEHFRYPTPEEAVSAATVWIEQGCEGKPVGFTV